MSGRLVPCPSCQRHVRTGADSCPFCDVLLETTAEAPAPIAPPGGLGRAGLFLHAARGAKALAGAVVGTSMLAAASCGDDVQGQALYGAVCDVDACFAPMVDASDELVLADAQVVVDAGPEPAPDATPPVESGAAVDAPSDAPADTGGHGETGPGDAPHD